jgi:radical SAM superfamily enzyme YgiQ (UPF0313 family)
MDVLLLRPSPLNERFGTAPFFRTEPLGLEYVAAALEARGHRTTAVDLRFGGPVERWISRVRPGLIGISCMHSVEIDETLELIRAVRRAAPQAFLLLGGHSAAAFPAPLKVQEVDAIAVDDGERVAPDLADVLSKGGSARQVPGLLVNVGGEQFVATGRSEPISLDQVPLPARHALASGHRHYSCLQFKPVWVVETARGCPYRCSFCSVWSLYHRSFRFRSIDAVCRDFASVGPYVFIVDDLFWHGTERSLDLAHELVRRQIRKEWIVVQSRTDLVAAHPELLEAWKPFSKSFDIFFGLEAVTDGSLNRLDKDNSVEKTLEGVRVAREHGFGVTGNFVIDPDWDEDDFRRLWAFVDTHKLHRAGYTIHTPFPGTPYYETVRHRLRAPKWTQFDVSHLLWEPKLGAQRFFELYCETWRRSVLNLSGNKPWYKWLGQIKLRQFPLLMRALARTQRLMDPSYYLAEHDLLPTEAGTCTQAAAERAATPESKLAS